MTNVRLLRGDRGREVRRRLPTSRLGVGSSCRTHNIGASVDRASDRWWPSRPWTGSRRSRRRTAAGIRFVQLQFTDIIGHVKAVTIPLHQLEGSVRHGTWFDGSSIEGFTRIAESDQYLMPDMATFAEIPWQKGLRPARDGSRHLRRVHAARRALRRRPTRRAPHARSNAPASSAISSTPARSWNSSCSDAARTARSSRCRTIRPAISTSRPTSPRKSARTWWTRSRRSGSGRGRPSRGRGRPARDRLRVRGRAADCRQRDHLQVRAEGDRPAARPLRDVHAQADPWHQRLGHAHPHSLFSIEQGRNAFADENTYGLSELPAHSWPASSPMPGA